MPVIVVVIVKALAVFPPFVLNAKSVRCCGSAGSGAPVRHVRVALRGGAGPVPVDPEGASERPDGAGGESG